MNLLISYLHFRSESPNIPQFVHLVQKLSTNPPVSEMSNVLATSGGDEDFEDDEFLQQGEKNWLIDWSEMSNE